MNALGYVSQVILRRRFGPFDAYNGIKAAQHVHALPDGLCSHRLSACWILSSGKLFTPSLSHG